MPSFELDDNRAIYQIRAYKPGMIQVNDKKYTQSIIISADQLIDNWEPQTLNELTPESFSTIILLKPTILILGTGDHLIFPPIETYGHLINHGIGVEIMDTRAACRTFNALTAENREVVGALIIH